jgi:hypothetical protein
MRTMDESRGQRGAKEGLHLKPEEATGKAN